MKATDRGVAGLIAVLLGLVAVWFSASSSPRVPEPCPAPRGPLVSCAHAESIALREVRRRECWLGKADTGVDGNRWYVRISGDPRSQDNMRIVIVDTDDGHIVDYQLMTPKAKDCIEWQ